MASGAADDLALQASGIGAGLDEENLYLDPDAAYAGANRLAGEQGGCPRSPRTPCTSGWPSSIGWPARIRADNAGPSGERLAGGRRDVLHFLRGASLEVSERPSEPSRSTRMSDKQAGNGDGCVGRFLAMAEKIRPTEPSHSSQGIAASGPNGTVGGYRRQHIRLVRPTLIDRHLTSPHWRSVPGGDY